MMTKIIVVYRSKKKGLGKLPQALSIDTTQSFKRTGAVVYPSMRKVMTLFPYTRLSSSSTREKSSLAFPLQGATYLTTEKTLVLQLGFPLPYFSLTNPSNSGAALLPLLRNMRVPLPRYPYRQSHLAQDLQLHKS